FALELQTTLTGGEATSAFGSSEAGLGDWIIPLVVASLGVGLIGLVMQQLFLRWNQGQDLRQALITTAIGIIIAHQTRAPLGGIAESLAAPDFSRESVALPFSDL